nr:flocculation protein FLO11-like [Parasteatoda tepidariorum]
MSHRNARCGKVSHTVRPRTSSFDAASKLDKRYLPPNDYDIWQIRDHLLSITSDLEEMNKLNDTSVQTYLTTSDSYCLGLAGGTFHAIQAINARPKKLSSAKTKELPPESNPQTPTTTDDQMKETEPAAEAEILPPEPMESEMTTNPTESTKPEQPAPTDITDSIPTEQQDKPEPTVHQEIESQIEDNTEPPKKKRKKKNPPPQPSESMDIPSVNNNPDPVVSPAAQPAEETTDKKQTEKLQNINRNLKVLIKGLS